MQKLLGDSSLEEIEYYISALGRVRQALEHAREQGPLSQAEADLLLSRWLTE
ncbi:MAG TPA: hypothetical protein VGZ28_10935 [Terriglobales bacterium]|jgi:hypothetical protein|nr:hypothetical protein [Terriglobales bacterium]